mmetsp:Transcript_9631/g.20935  ORF Transcript_9631/g.20935 Transcript_9631/m.20935 type:complete len:434 (-) Transcript_9631:34-1335(-)
MALEYRYHALFRKLFPPAMKAEIPDVATAVQLSDALTRAGYLNSILYDRIAIFINGSEADVSELVAAARVYGTLERFHGEFFEGLSRRLVDEVESMSGSDLATVVFALSNHGDLRTQEPLMRAIADIVGREPNRFATYDIVTCLHGFRRLRLCYEPAIVSGMQACEPQLQHTWISRLPGVVSASRLAMLLEASAYFGIFVPSTTDAILRNVEDVVDYVSERAAIQLVFSMAVFPGVAARHEYLFGLLFRRIGAGTSWEKDKLRVFALWISQMVQFPWLDYDMHPRTVNASLREWVRVRQGHGSPYPREVAQVSCELEEMGVGHTCFKQVDAPYELDIVLEHSRDVLLVVSEVAANTGRPVNGALLQLTHLQQLGWVCHVVSRSQWRDLPIDRRQEYLVSVLHRVERARQLRISGGGTVSVLGSGQGGLVSIDN